MPLNTDFAVSQRSIKEVFGESFISMKDVNYFYNKLTVLVLLQRCVKPPSGSWFLLECSISAGVNLNWCMIIYCTHIDLCFCNI